MSKRFALLSSMMDHEDVRWSIRRNFPWQRSDQERLAVLELQLTTAGLDVTVFKDADVVMCSLPGDRAKRPACFLVTRGHRPVPGKAERAHTGGHYAVLLYEAGVNYAGLEDPGPNLALWIENQDRMLWH